MEILVAASLPRFPLSPQFSKTHRKSLAPQFLNCSRNIRESNGLSRAPIPRELGSTDKVENHLKSVGNEKEKKKQNDIWQLFEEAQQNILYLNKQRLLAMEELERVKNERNSLLDRIEQLEMRRPSTARKDKLTISSELLLRIDALVLNGMIGSTEASTLRRLVIDSRGSLADDVYEIILKNDAEFLAELRLFSKTSKGNGFHIIHVCTEMSPVVSVGSLAPYITGLSCALQRKGNLVEVILPKEGESKAHCSSSATLFSWGYFQEVPSGTILDRVVLLQEKISEKGTLLYACLNLDEVHGLREVEAEFYSYFNGQLHGNKIWTGVVYGIGVTFIEPVYYSSFFSQEKVYGYSNDFERFTYFSRASLDYLVKSGKRPDVLHIHNWHTSIVGPLFWDVFVNQGFENTRIVLTCQGFDSQCLEQPEKVALCGLDPSRLLRPDRLQDNNKSHLVNVLKGGVVYSNKVIIMTSVHSKGQIISALGHGLEPSLDMHKEKLVIAPSGFDKSTWDPSCDDFLPQSYSADDMKGKFVCKFALQRHLGLEEGLSKILVGCICSGISDVDLDKLKMLVWVVSSKGVQFIFMGSGQIPGMTRAFEIFQDEVKHKDVRFIDEYDEELSHLIISGSDIMLCPSFDDHLLQVPLKAIKYGAAPVLVDFAESRFRHLGNDSTERSRFSQYINSAFGSMSLTQAIDEIKNNPSEWNRRIKDAMGKDFSWDSECAEVHISAYEEVKKL